MADEISFAVSYSYRTLESGIVVPVEMSNSEETVRFETKIDTGAQFCVFQKQHGKRLGL